MKTYEMIYLALKAEGDYISGEELAQRLGISRTSIWKGIQQLEKKGLVIDSVKHKGYCLLQGDLLLADQLAQDLGFPVFYQADSQSTQLDAKHGIEQGHPAPTLYLAPSQRQAKGRFDRTFFASQTGGIYMSLRLSPQVTFEEVKPYTLLAAASIVKAIEELTGIQVEIKWVNDIYYRGKKIGGILTEAIASLEMKTVSDMVIGVGFNFHISDFPKDLTDKVGSLFEQRPPVTRQDLIARIWQIFFETPEDQLLALYKERSLVLGKNVSFQQAGQTYRGRATDLTATGELVVQLDSGQEKILSSGEISLSSWGNHPKNE